MRPKVAREYGPIELKLGIKSSMPNVKSAIALFIALWKACGQNSEHFYTQQVAEKILVNEDSFSQLKIYFGRLISDEDMFRDSININPLITSQMEALKVTFELIWKIGIFEFEDKSKVYSAERSGGIRLAKKIYYTKNIDIINLIVKQNEDACKQVLYSWITKSALKEEFKENEDDLISGLTLISEEAVYRLRIDESTDIKFMNLGIYERYIDGNEQVNASDYKENMGGLRILHKIFTEGLNSFLRKNGSNIEIKDAGNITVLKEYAKRVEKYLSLTTISIDVIIQENIEQVIEPVVSDINFPRNRIVFGAPGTGKSYTLEQQRTIFGDNYERVTFHPNYSYAQFVGTYKPKPKIRNGSEYVSYEYNVGPFLRLWLAAMKNKDTNYLLIVEEINRASVASVFGDIFQLLDRDANGTSEYEVTTSEDLREYLVKEHSFTESEIKTMRIPQNLYIWATMNSADQGVFPMDAAFKRRWSFEYIGIDEGISAIKGKTITLKPYGTIEWNLIRTKINDKLTSQELNINEDMLIGPFFISDKELGSSEIDKIFKNKLIMYLFEDVLKHRKGKFFASQYNSFSKLLAAYDIGENVFDFNLTVTSNDEPYVITESSETLKMRVADGQEDY